MATTTAPYKARAGEATQWLDKARGMVKDAHDHGFALSFFAALELAPGPDDHLGDYDGLWDRFDALPALGAMHATAWTFSVDDGTEKIDSDLRLMRICMGRNLCITYATRAWCSHVMFLDSDVTPPADIVSKLLEVDWPIAGAEVPLYGLSGPRVSGYPFPLQEHWNTAGALLVRREVFRRVRWRSDAEAGLTDDPCFAFDAEAAGFGKTRVRKDVVCSHLGQTMLWPLEMRGQDLAVR